ncbi:MAG: adenylate/guanylate cyclase domain-containing protein [Gammaproteobacteria bacterium]|nr:adenylate/guanylate cyclase domain-containing protein [Gammaproteobacteria bacterium]
MKSRTHPLIELAYRPRVIAYLGTGAIIVSMIPTRVDTGWLLALLFFSLIYPQLVYWTASRWFNSRNTAVRIQYIDSVFAGILCAAIHLAPLPLVSIISALFISTMLLFGVAGCLSGCIWFSVGFALYVVFEGFYFEPEVGLLTIILSGSAVCIYGVTISYIVYHWVLVSNAGLSRMRHHHDRLRGVTDQLSKYISPQIYHRISEDTLPADFRTNRKKLTVFFSDVEDFTELTDNMEAEGLTLLLNEYLDEMAQIVLQYGGTIDKFMGDGLMAFFGDPTTKGSHDDAFACVSMALQMRRRMVQLRKKWQEDGIAKPLHIRIGINTGYCTVGNFGSEARLDYTIIGSSVNIASRLEGAATRDEILISYETYLLIKDRMFCERKPEIRVKGIGRPIEVYEVKRLMVDQDGIFIRESAGFRLTMDSGIVEPEKIYAVLQETLAETQRLQLLKSQQPLDGTGLSR